MKWNEDDESSKKYPMNAPRSGELLYEVELTGAGMWSKIISRGKILRIEDLKGGANVGMLLYNGHEKLERYNMPDTLKGQQIFYLRSPYCLHSDMGRLLCSITADSCGWHDTVCGFSDAEQVKEKFGGKSFQEAGNHWHQNGRDCFLTELGKWGLGERDLVPNLNWFSKVVSDSEGNLCFVPDHSQAGDYVELRMETDVLIVLNTCSHPMNPNGTYQNQPVKLSVRSGEPPSSEDPSLQVCPENQRAFRNTDDYHKLRF